MQLILQIKCIDFTIISEDLQKNIIALFKIPNSIISVYLNFQEMDMNASYQKNCRQQIRTLN